MKYKIFAVATSILSASSCLRKSSAHKVVGLRAQTISMTPRCSAGWAGHAREHVHKPGQHTEGLLPPPAFKATGPQGQQMPKNSKNQVFPTIYIY